MELGIIGKGLAALPKTQQQRVLEPSHAPRFLVFVPMRDRHVVPTSIREGHHAHHRVVNDAMLRPGAHLGYLVQHPAAWMHIRCIFCQH